MLLGGEQESEELACEEEEEPCLSLTLHGCGLCDMMRFLSLLSHFLFLPESV
jgi:hypothetical protein